MRRGALYKNHNSLLHNKGVIALVILSYFVQSITLKLLEIWGASIGVIDFLVAVSTVLVFYTMLISVLKTHTHAKRQQNPLKNVASLMSSLSVLPAIVRNASILNLLKCVFICWCEYDLTISSIYILLCYFLGSTLTDPFLLNFCIHRVPTVREKSVKNEKSSRSGKSQGVLI